MSCVWIPIPSIFTSPFISRRSPESAEETMSPLNRFEISGCELIEANQEAAKRFEKMGWAPLEEISTQNGPFNFYSNSMSSCVSQ